MTDTTKELTKHNTPHLYVAPQVPVVVAVSHVFACLGNIQEDGGISFLYLHLTNTSFGERNQPKNIHYIIIYLTQLVPSSSLCIQSFFVLFYFLILPFPLTISHAILQNVHQIHLWKHGWCYQATVNKPIRRQNTHRHSVNLLLYFSL